MRKLRVLVLVLVTMSAATAALVIPALAATTSVKVGDDYFVRDGGFSIVTVDMGPQLFQSKS
jgi:hypothetical protein